MAVEKLWGGDNQASMDNVYDTLCEMTLPTETQPNLANQVAVMDTGIIDHPEFAGWLYVNPGEIPGNLLDDDGNGFVDDVSGWSGIDMSNDVMDLTEGFLDVLKVSSVDLGPPGWDPEFGWGRIHAHRAVRECESVFSDGFETGATSQWSSSSP